MLTSAYELFWAKSRSREHQRRRRAAVAFGCLWIASLVASISSSFLLLSIQSLVLLNTTVSLAANVITQSLLFKTTSAPPSGRTSYPFCFGLQRLSVVVRLGGAVFLVFGCITTMVESLHRGTHVHEGHPFPLLTMAVAHAALLLLFARDVLAVDRVTGYSSSSGQEWEELLHKSYAATTAASAAADHKAMGGGELFVEKDEMMALATLPRGVARITAAMVVFFLCPTAAFLVFLAMFSAAGAIADMAMSIALAAFYLRVGYREGFEMLSLVMNKSICGERQGRNLDRLLRGVKMLDGVLQVYSTIWWRINVVDSMVLVRLRLMSGSDAAAVSMAVRKLLSEVATYVYVECFPPNGGDISGASAMDPRSMSWLPAPHSHSHAVSTSCHGHSHSHGQAPEEHHGHHHDCHSHDHDHEHLLHHGDDDQQVAAGTIFEESTSVPIEFSPVKSPNGFSAGANGAAPHTGTALALPATNFVESQTLVQPTSNLPAAPSFRFPTFPSPGENGLWNGMSSLNSFKSMRPGGHSSESSFHQGSLRVVNELHLPSPPVFTSFQGRKSAAAAASPSQQYV